MNTHANNAANGAEKVSWSEPPPLRSISLDSDIGRFLASSSSLWRKQRDRLDELEAAYTAERFRKVEAFQKRMQALGNEASDALREFDCKHAAQVAEGRRMLAALAALRDS